MTYLRFLLVPFIWLLAGPAFANDAQPARVVELFTSQGCSSCPPANNFAGEIAEHADTLVLSYGVTYWDYLGWKDTFASPEFTERQKAYGRAFGSSNVYTPQLILNGSAHSSSYSEHDVKSMNLPADKSDIILESQNGILNAKNMNKNKDLKSVAVLVEYVRGPQSVAVDAGENHGRVLTLTNVVTDVRHLGPWTSTQPLDTGLSPKEGKSYALLLHHPETSKLLGAARYTQ